MTYRLVVAIRRYGRKIGRAAERRTGDIDISVLDLFQIHDGMLFEHWALLYNLGMLEQPGALPT